MPRPPVLIEEWLPIEEVGIESQRERGASSALPPLYFMHVWWARRPLTASRGAILASVLPQWSADWPADLRGIFPDEATYREWFLKLCGIQGDPVAAKRRIVWANEHKVKLKGNAYGYPRAFTVNPSAEDLDLLRRLLKETWGKESLTVADAMAGGGSIPFESLRYGFTTIANELNPVAAVILHATLEFPFRFGPQLTAEIKRWGMEVARRAERRLDSFFPRREGESIFAYIWARTVPCPSTGKPVPLAPNWWLQKGDSPVAVKLIADPDDDVCRFEIVKGKAAEAANPDDGTVKRGVGRSPWTGDSIPEDYIKDQARTGRMGQQLYALGVKTSAGTSFRLPTVNDVAAVAAAEEELAKRLPRWEALGMVPREPFPEQCNDPRPLHYGMPTWAGFFSQRQLLSLLTYLDVIHEAREGIDAESENDRARAIRTFLSLMLAKAVDRNSYLASWIPQRQVIAHTFVRHDFSFRWAYAEFDAAHNLWPWTVGQIADAYNGLAKLADGQHAQLVPRNGGSMTITARNAASLPDTTTSGVDLICVDPPYYDNVMYAELSDFFYVWHKRSIGDLYPDLFVDELTNKDEEAVANQARFADVGGKKRKLLAEEDYERKMTACFKEMRRVLSDDGVLTVMFTHKKVEAWDRLASALIQAGFVVETSWPVHTEFEHSTHQAKKNAAASTILLVCRKRAKATEPVWWDDIKSKVRQTARERAEEFERAGIRGVDLYLSTFGPVLAVISERWPVYTGEVDEKTGEQLVLRPEAALDLARQEVVELRKKGLLLGRTIEFDPVTDWYLMAWDAFSAEQFPADEARKLAIVLDLDLEKDLIQRRRLVTKKQQFVAFLTPVQRRKPGLVDPEATAFGALIDALQTAMLVYADDGDRACERFLNARGLRSDARFKELLRAVLYAIPRTKVKGRFVRKEAELAEALRLHYFDDLEPPAEEVPPEDVVVQGAFEISADGDEIEVTDEDEEM